MRSLPLESVHDRRGALLRTEAGWSVPAGYGPLEGEVRAVRTRTGMIDLSDRAKIELVGAERVPFLDGVVTADLKVLAPGTSAYALLLNEKSRVLGDLRVYAFPDSLVLDVEAVQKESVLHLLDKARVSDDVEFRDLGAPGHIELHGPTAGAAVSGLAGSAVRDLPRDGFLTVPLDRATSAHVAHLPSVGSSGYAIWSTASRLSEVWDRLAAFGVIPVGRDAWEVLRIEAGIPRFGIDMGPDTLALEAAPESAISFTKGCYVGQEVVARGTYVGQVRRRLLGLQVEGDLPPTRGDRVSARGHEVGAITSGAWSPTLTTALAMAVLRVDAVSPGDTLFIDRAGWDLRARLRKLPFVTDSV